MKKPQYVTVEYLLLVVVIITISNLVVLVMLDQRLDHIESRVFPTTTTTAP